MVVGGRLSFALYLVHVPLLKLFLTHSTTGGCRSTPVTRSTASWWSSS
jgi:peptidoglycan/LPS O-acetylase OafA/YrhL